MVADLRVLHVGPDTATTGGMATVIGLLTGSVRSGIRHESAETWSPDSKTHGLRSTVLLIYRLLSAKRSRPDWIHAHLSERGSFLREGAVLLVARALGVGTAATVHGAEFVAFSERHPDLVRRILSACRVVFTLGPHAAARASALCPATSVTQIMNPVDLDELAGAAPASMRSSVLFGGEVGERKGVDRLVEAWPEVRRRHPDATCVLCGPLGDVEVDVLPEGMTYLGSVPRRQLLGLLKTTSVACLPSRNEALPMFILESLALGVPVVTTSVGEIGQLGETHGVALSDGDPSNVAARLNELLGDREKRTEWGRRGSEWAREKCSVESVTHSLEVAYRTERGNDMTRHGRGPGTALGGLFQDWTANRGRPGIQVLLVLFRAAQAARGKGGTLRRLAAAPVMVAYRLVALTLFSVDVPVSTAVGRGLAIHHGMGLVVNRATRIGEHVTLRHSTTLGGRRTDDDCPVIGSHVDVGPNSVLLGSITVGERALIGAGSVVLHDVPAAASVAGNPARILPSRSGAPC